jgi:hypothetical protein
MEIIGEIIVAILQIVLQIVLEIVVQIVGEVVAALFGHSVREVFRRPEPLSPFLAAVGYIILGAGMGGISLLIVPELFIGSRGLRIANLVVTPIAAGLVMGMIGSYRRKKELNVIRLESFAYGALFAFSMATVRMVWGVSIR